MDHILEHVELEKFEDYDANSRFTEVLRLLEFGDTQIIKEVERRCSFVTGYDPRHLAKLRIVRPGTHKGMCNRGNGTHVIYVSLREQEEVCFPQVGCRFLLSKGDALRWSNVLGSDTEGLRTEDLRVKRFHSVNAIGLEVHFHMNAIREQQNID